MRKGSKHCVQARQEVWASKEYQAWVPSHRGPYFQSKRGWKEPETRFPEIELTTRKPARD